VRFKKVPPRRPRHPRLREIGGLSSDVRLIDMDLSPDVFQLEVDERAPEATSAAKECQRLGPNTAAPLHNIAVVSVASSVSEHNRVKA